MATKRKPLRAPSTQSQFTAVLESIDLRNRIAMEAISGLRTEMTRRFDNLEAAVLDLGHRVKALEIKVESLEIKTSALELAVRQNTEELARVRAEVAHLADIARGKAEAKDIAALAERVARLEARVGL